MNNLKEIKANKIRSFLLDLTNHEMIQKMKEKDQTKLNHKTPKQIISEFDNYEVHIDHKLVTFRSSTQNIIHQFFNKDNNCNKSSNSNLSSRRTSYSETSETNPKKSNRKTLSHSNFSKEFHIMLFPLNFKQEISKKTNFFRLKSKTLWHTAFKLKHLISKKQHPK